VLQEVVNFDILEIPSGTVCYDWVVPDEWNVTDAYVENSAGQRIIDFKANNLHLVSYSIPVNLTMPFKDLERHLHTLPDLPRAIPYRTSYYHKNWGFCVSYEDFSRMDRNEQYHVRIDTTLEPGSLTRGEGVIEGGSGQEFLISTYCCHPSTANDNLSGPVLWALLFRELRSRKLRHSYRFVIGPETIGAIAYLSQAQEVAKNLAGGFVITTVAGPGTFGYKHTYLGNHLIDRIVHKAFDELHLEYIPYPFDINGSDERQYSTPAFRIPVGTICKDKYYEYDYYHTSLDNLDFINARDLVETLKLYLLSIENLEMNLTFRSLNPHCEPMLGKRNLYPQISGHIKQRATDLKKVHDEPEYLISEGNTLHGSDIDTMLWLMFESDGKTSLLEISEKTGFMLAQLYDSAKKLEQHGLLEIVADEEGRER
jgi:aminopeptidase-like protein